MGQEVNSSGGNAQSSFLSFILRKKGNRRLLWIALGGTLIQFIVFKILYPFPDFFSDSYSYIYAAQAHLDISIWPIGYSKFLAAFHAITHSDIALISFQYFFLELSAMYFFFTILYFYQLGKTTSNILFLFLFFNPLFLYLSNYVNSDPLFAALSLFWFSQLIWVIQQPAIYQIFVQAILLFLCFTVRNNAYYYPIITTAAFLLSRHQTWAKLSGIVLPILLITPFIINTRNIARKLTGTPQFSLFTGWQLANNALYVREQIDLDWIHLPTPETKELDRYSRSFYTNLPIEMDFNNYLSSYIGNYFIRQPESPLKKYLSAHYQVSNDSTMVLAWGKASAVFDVYGKYIITHYPMTFARYFMLLNVRNYCIPPLEKLEIYNLGTDYVWPIAAFWFHYPTSKISVASKTAQGNLLILFPFLFLTLNLSFVSSLIWYVTKKMFARASPGLNRSILMIASFVIVNFIFSISATIIVLRYEIFPMIILLPFSLLLFKMTANIENKNSALYKYTSTKYAIQDEQ